MVAIFELLKQLIALVMAVVSLLGIKTTSAVDVELYANPSSGYMWEYSYDKNGIVALTDEYYLPDPSAILSSGGGTQKFTFQAIGPGIVNITFRYVDTLGKDIASTYVYTYSVDETGEIELISVK